MSKKIFVSFVLVAICLATASMAIAQTPVAWYKFNEGTSTATIDSSATANPAALVNMGGSPWSADVAALYGADAGFSMSFTSIANGAVTAPHNAALNPGLGSVTVSFLTKWPAAAYALGRNAAIVTKGARSANAANGGHYTAYINNATTSLRFEANDSQNDRVYADVAVNTTNFLDGQWHHVVGVLDRDGITTASMYLDGVKVSGGIWGAGSSTNNVLDSVDVLDSSSQKDLYIGNTSDFSSQNRSFTALVDDVRIYTRALSEYQISNMYVEPTPFVASANHWEIFD